MFLILLIIQQTPLSYQKRPNLKCSPISYLLSFVVWAVFNFVSSGTVVTCFLSLSLSLQLFAKPIYPLEYYILYIYYIYIYYIYEEKFPHILVFYIENVVALHVETLK